MPRKKLSEFRAKTLLFAALGQNYRGLEVQTQLTGWEDGIAALPNDTNYVVKVDQAIKGRFKKGLVQLDCPQAELVTNIRAMIEQGYQFFIVEPYQSHDQALERFFSLERSRDGLLIAYSEVGGVDVESHADQIKHFRYGEALPAGLPGAGLEAIVAVFNQAQMCFLEINPLVVDGDDLWLLDAAVEVDSEGMFFQDGWSTTDFRSLSRRTLSPEELAVQELSDTSQASFSFELINADGSIFVLLSGGGASVVVADEVCDQGFGQELANYGEYSGNPNLEETRLYTGEVIKALLRSRAERKVLLIGGGVANFTDVSVTFKGLIAALSEYVDQLRQQGVQIFVRRGGPHEVEGLAMMRDFMTKSGLEGRVNGPELPLSALVTEALEVLK